MKNRVPSENHTPDASQPPETPILNAVRMEIAALCRAMIEDRARLDRQRRRVEALLWDGSKASAARALLSAMERAYSLKEIYRDHLIDVSGALDHGPRLHPYDLDQRAQGFGVTGEVLRSVVAQLGPDLARVEAALASQHDAKPVHVSAMAGIAITSKGQARPRRSRESPRQEDEEVHG
jgi:hypothetical protein